MTQYSYDADDRVTKTTVDPGRVSDVDPTQTYDPERQRLLPVSANAVRCRFDDVPVPALADRWIVSPPIPSSLYSSTPTSAQANNVTTAFYDADGNEVQSTDPDVQTTVNAVDPDGRTYCTSIRPTWRRG